MSQRTRFFNLTLVFWALTCWASSNAFVSAFMLRTVNRSPVPWPPCRAVSSSREKAPAFSASWPPRTCRSHRRSEQGSCIMSNAISNDEIALAFWMASFSVSHIGMSAVRGRLISACGDIANSANLVGENGLLGTISLPSYWPGDDVGKKQLFPDSETAGRQIYRAGYTAVSFTTLGMALAAYLAATKGVPPSGLLAEHSAAAFGVASACSGISIASLFNASPLSLVPGFEKTASQDDAFVADIRRNDALKFEPRGLTRITRHPLILPVVPWGVATAVLTGGRVADLLLFGGLSLYAVAGCAAQDLRVLRQEGSVGTVFQPASQSGEAGTGLEEFFAATSFVPFAAVADGRQSLELVAREVPWAALGGGCVVGAAVQLELLQALRSAAGT